MAACAAITATAMAFIGESGTSDWGSILGRTLETTQSETVATASNDVTVNDVEIVGNNTSSNSGPKRVIMEPRYGDGNSVKGLGLSHEMGPVGENPKMPVILIDFPDRKFCMDDPHDFYDRMFNQDGFDGKQYCPGSVAEYFRYSSNGGLDLTFDVYGPVTMKNERAYYGKKTSTMCAEALSYYTDSIGIDFAMYDSHEDHYVDNIHFVFAGQSKNMTGEDEDPKARWTNSTFFIRGNCWEKVGDWLCCESTSSCCELLGEGLLEYGAHIHEITHGLGIPDLYDAYSVSQGGTMGRNLPGCWAITCSGHGLDCPTPFSSYEMNALGYIDPTALKEPAILSLSELHSTGQCYCIINPNEPSEFFLLENRQKKDWDKSLPGHGLVIWYVNYSNSARFECNTIIDDYHGRPRVLDLIHSDQGRQYKGDYGVTFPGYYKVTEITSETIPCLKWADGSYAPDITNIEERDGMVYFDFDGGVRSLPAPAELDTTTVTTHSATLAWDPVENALQYVVTLTDRDGQQHSQTVTTMQATFDMLDADTQYTVSVQAKRNKVVSEASTIDFRTPEIDITKEKVKAKAATDLGERAFTANWHELEGAAGYLLTVEALMEDSTTVTLDGFDETDLGNTSSAKITLPLDEILGWEQLPQKYTYTVTAYDAKQRRSLPSDPVGVKPYHGKLLDTPQLTGTSLNVTTFTIDWNHVDHAKDYLVTVKLGTDTVGTYTTTRPTCKVDSLLDETAYTVTLQARKGKIVSEAAIHTVNTLGYNLQYNRPTATEATDIDQRGYTANWLKMDGAVSYTLTAYAVLPGGSEILLDGYDHRDVGQALSQRIDIDPEQIVQLGQLPESYAYHLTATDRHGRTSKTSNTVHTQVDLGELIAMPVPWVSDITPESLTIQWRTVDRATAYTIEITHDGQQITKTTTANTEINIVGLQAQTQYEITLWATNGQISSQGGTITATTAEYNLEGLTPTALPATDIADGHFTANWQRLKGATSYHLTVLVHYQYGMYTILDGYDNLDCGDSQSQTVDTDLDRLATTGPIDHLSYTITATDAKGRQSNESNSIQVDHQTLGIHGISLDEAASQWYTLDGQPLAEKPTATGIYIQRQGHQSRKILIQ